jgi:DNA-binding transcriptional ArsR family regulator
MSQVATLDSMFQALADPARRGMVERLSRGAASVSELAAPFDMSLSAVMQHVHVLEASGLVKTEKVGRVRTCSIEEKGMMKVEQWLTSRRATWERRFDRLGDFLLQEDAALKKKEKHGKKP